MTTPTKRKKRYAFAVGAALIGFIIALVSGFAVANDSRRNAEKLAQTTMRTLVDQCRSFDNIQASNRVKTLFAMNENLTSLNSTFLRDPTTVNDEFLEEYVDDMQLSGVAVLDEDLRLVASAYTRGMTQTDWRDDFYPGLFERMVDSSNHVYLERMNIDGQYYDVCATSRKDARGVVVAYYKQPMSLIYDTERDLKQLLRNVRMDLDGEFVIVHNGRQITDGSIVDDIDEFVATADKVLNADELATLYFSKTELLGTRYIYGGYSVYVYFPSRAVYRDAYVWTLISGLIYITICMAVLVVKTRVDRTKQRLLEENNRRLTESVSIMRSLETVYFTIFLVDLRTDVYKSIIIAPWINAVIDDSGTFTYSAGKLINTLVVPEYRETINQRLNFDLVRDSLQKPDDGSIPSSYYFDYEAENEDERRWYRVTVTAIDYDEDRKPVRVLVMLQDVDDEKSREVEYQKRIIEEADAAQAANRAKATFLFNVSHDIRTPMNAILGYSALAKKAINDPNKLDGYLDNIKVSGERMLSLINEVLEFARIENGKMTIREKAAKVGPGIESCIVMVKPIAEAKGIDVNLEVTGIMHPYIFVDHPHMSRIVLNLLNNAIKFTNLGGKIDCRVTQLNSEKIGYCVTEIVVEDNGVGISEEFLPHMFEMFEREKNSTENEVSGTGLGLGIVKKIVDLMEGTVSVESKVGSGSKFTVRVPSKIATEKQAATLEVEYSLDKQSVVGKRVLIAEDGDMNAEIIVEILSDEGIASERAENGEKCLNMLDARPDGYYDLVLMDIQMPVVDGFTAAKAIRADSNVNKSKIPIIAMTANAFPEDVKASFDAGMDGHLSKPINKNELMKVFEKFLGARLIRNESIKIGGGGKSFNGLEGGEYDDE